MSERSVSSPALTSSASGLSVLGLSLFILYGASLLGTLLPLQLVNPVWQLRMATALINGAPTPLIGLALLQIAADSGSANRAVRRRLRVCSQLACIAVLGFLLLLPLQVVAGLQQSRWLSTAQGARIQRAELKLSGLRQAVANATSGEDLSRQLQRLQGPALSPTYLALPLPSLKAQVSAVLDQVAQQIRRQRQLQTPDQPWGFLPGLLRNGIACLALALGFAALGRRPGSENTLLQEGQRTLQRWRWQLKARESNTSEADYIRQITGEDKKR